MIDNFISTMNYWETFLIQFSIEWTFSFDKTRVFATSLQLQSKLVQRKQFLDD